MVDADQMTDTILSRIRDEVRRRAEVLSWMGFLKSISGSCEMFRQADRIETGPVARRGARSHQAWRDALVDQLRDRAHARLVFGMILSYQHLRAAEGNRDGEG